MATNQDEKKNPTPVAAEAEATVSKNPTFTKNKKLNEQYEIVEDRHIVNTQFNHDGLVSEIRDEKQILHMLAKKSPYVKEKKK